MKRTEMKKGTKGLKRTKGFTKRYKAMGIGKHTQAKRDAMKWAIDEYFKRFGWVNDEGYKVARCQLSGDVMYRGHCVAHHKTPRSELRKSGDRTGFDTPDKLLICIPEVHLRWLHGGEMGRPKEPVALDRFVRAETSMANAENGMRVVWDSQHEFDLRRFRCFLALGAWSLLSMVT